MSAVVLLVGACIYDYVPPVPYGKGMVVINGDILIGHMTEVKVGRTVAIGSPFPGNLPVDAVYVEDGNGGVYHGVMNDDNGYEIDTRELDPSLDYRLVVELDGSVYESAWQPVLRASPIDSISHWTNEDETMMGVYVSTHSDTGSAFYRWIARQVWEYHAAADALFFFIPAGELLDGHPAPVDTVVPYEDRANYYFCWKSGEVADLLLASTEQLGENRMVNHHLFSMDCHDQRTQQLYFLELIQEALAPEAYRYYDAVRKNSTDVGGLFSPQPSEMRGNIRNRNNPGERVAGFVSVTMPAVERCFIDFNSFFFHKQSPWESVESETIVNREAWDRYYHGGYRVAYPVLRNEDMDPDRFYWVNQRCVDCRLYGGTKEKPSWWPNDHR